MLDIRLTPSDIALRAAIGEFNIAFCNSRKYRNPKGIISHFALAKYFTDNFSHHPLGWCFFGFLGALHQEPVIINLPFYRLSVATEVGSDPTAAGGRDIGDPAKANGLCGGRRSQDTGGISCLQEMERCILCFDEASGSGLCATQPHRWQGAYRAPQRFIVCAILYTDV